MLTAHTRSGQTMTKRLVNLRAELPADAVWVDLNNPTDQERNWVKAQYGQELQFIEELGEIEASSRFYRDEMGVHIHLYFLAQENGRACNVNVAFTINKNRLFSLRTDELAEIRTYFSVLSRDAGEYPDAASLLLGLVATRVGTMADTFEKLQTDLDNVSGSIFRGGAHTLTNALEALARIEDVNGKARLGFMENKRAYTNLSRHVDITVNQNSLNELLRDVESLMNFSDFLAERTKFLMDAAIGMINIAHNRRLNVFTVLSVVLMPPMLIASIYGMNFRHMPELDWLFGYPISLGLMLLVMVGAIFFLRRRGWF
ncbi:MAG: magnesium transporter CorA [Betaproteobacteria bacterium]|nr:magnesium transporter CorA [Betaproteobacteria bacterium]